MSAASRSPTAGSMGAAPVRFTPRADGTLLVTPVPALGAYPRSLTDRLALYAADAPERTLIAQRDKALGGDWRRISYGAMWRAVQSLGQALHFFQQAEIGDLDEDRGIAGVTL